MSFVVSLLTLWFGRQKRRAARRTPARRRRDPYRASDTSYFMDALAEPEYVRVAARRRVASVDFLPGGEGDGMNIKVDVLADKSG